MLGDLLFGPDRTEHPLELPRDTHRKREIELKEKQQRLRERKRDLKSRLDDKKQEYFDRRDEGNEQRAEELQRDAEDIKEKLETVQTKLDTVDQMLTTVSNFLNIYEIKALGQDEYWQRLREMDREELIETFSRSKIEAQELIDSIDVTATAGHDVINDLSAETSQLHSSSSLGWEEEYEGQASTEDTEENNSTFEFDETKESGLPENLNDDDLQDLQPS